MYIKVYQLNIIKKTKKDYKKKLSEYRKKYSKTRKNAFL